MVDRESEDKKSRLLQTFQAFLHINRSGKLKTLIRLNREREKLHTESKIIE